MVMIAVTYNYSQETPILLLNNMKNIKRSIALAMLSCLLITLSSSCSEDSAEKEATIVTLIDLTGLDGCGWALVLPDDNRLEPVNLHQFEIDLVEDHTYEITYHLMEGGSICMVGQMIKLQSIEKVISQR